MLVYAIKGSAGLEFGPWNLELRLILLYIPMYQSAFCYFGRNI